MRCEVEFQLLKKETNAREFITLSWRMLQVIYWWSKSIYLFGMAICLFWIPETTILMMYRGEEQTKIRNDKHMARRMVTQEVAGKERSLFLYDPFPQNFTNEQTARFMVCV